MVAFFVARNHLYECKAEPSFYGCDGVQKLGDEAKTILLRLKYQMEISLVDRK
jgi:hypothetical protein